MDCEIKSFHTLLDLQAEEEGFMTARQTTNRGHVEMRTHRKWKFECHGRLNISIISSKVQVHKQSIWLICLNEISADLLLCLSLLYMQVWLKTQWFYTELSQFPKAFRGVMTVNSSSFGAYLPYPCHLSPLISCGSRSNQNVADGLTGSYEIIIHFLSIQKKTKLQPKEMYFECLFLFSSLLEDVKQSQNKTDVITKNLSTSSIMKTLLLFIHSTTRLCRHESTGQTSCYQQTLNHLFVALLLLHQIRPQLDCHVAFL